MKDFLRLLKLFHPYWGWALLGIFVSFISLMANIVLLSLSGWFITTMALAGVTGAAVNYFTPAAIIRACAILRTGGRYLERVITHEATFRFMAEMRSWLYQRIEDMPLARSSQYHSGDLLARLRGDIDTLESFYISIIIPSCVAFIGLIFVTAALALYSVPLALLQLGLLLFAGVIIPFIAYQAAKKTGQKIIYLKAVLKIQMVENVQSFSEMTIYGIAPQRMTQALSLSDDIIIAQRKLGIMDGVAQGMNNFLANIALWSALTFSLYLYQTNVIEKAHIPMLSLLALASFEAVLPLSLAFQSLEGCLQAARRLFALDDEPQEKPSSTLLSTDRFDLRMTNVSFGYDDRQVVQNFSLHLFAGQKILLAGPSGIGKSSILHLLTGLYPVKQGQITLNGQDYSQLAPENIRQFFAVVPQRPHIFAGTIRTNLLIADPKASDSQLLDACRIACFDQYIIAQEKGLDTYLGEGGTTLSGGEIRRLAIARAILKDAPCLLLDEPTENLDQATARQLKDNLFDYAHHKALLLISHEKKPDDRFSQIIIL